MTLSLANPGAAGTGVLLSAQGNAGFVVPPGYSFHPTVLMASSNAVLTAGQAVFNVTDNTVAVVGGPVVILISTGPTTRDAQVSRIGVAPILAGHLVGVNVVTNGAYAPATADFDVTLGGVLIAG
jgi:hypothetical protein